ncbi:MAG: hypothetical protein COA43_13345 [Robiginitomaculum sp.]|nr:MAG: hypothetical protein COA43_13345 [Robiginitomaculum sp.]
MTTESITPQQNVSDIVEAEALAWVVQLTGDEDITEKDLVAFREWINRSPAHGVEINELAEIWGDLNILTTMDEPIRQADKISKQLRKQYARKIWRRRFTIPTLILCSAIVFSIMGRGHFIHRFNSSTIQSASVNIPIVFKSSIGEQQKQTLADGSTITLNTDSHIEVDFTANQRNVRLIKGEALFVVAHDASRPFLVFAKDGIVRAVGTEFSVHILEKGIDVLVAEGSVELSTLSPTKPRPKPRHEAIQAQVLPVKMAHLGIINAGHSAKIVNAKASIEVVSADMIDAELSWQNGLLTFTGQPLEEVIAEVSRYTQLNIILEDVELKKIRIGGVFKSGETDVLFRTLEASFAIRIEATDDYVRIMPKL